MSDCKIYVSKEDLQALKESQQHIEHVARSRNAAGEKALQVTDPIRGENVTNRTLDGLENLYTTSIDNFEARGEDALRSVGWVTLDSFQRGAEITARNQVLRDETNGEYYRWDGELPKSVPAGSTPDSAGGIGMGSWVGIGDASLRNELSSDKGAGIINTINGNSVQDELIIITKLKNIPSKFKSIHEDAIDSTMYPQGVAESDNFMFIMKYDKHVSPIVSNITRVNKSTKSEDLYTVENAAIHDVIVLNDDEIIHVSPVVNNDGYAYVESLTQYNFKTKSSSSFSFPKMNSAHAITWDGKDILYQLDLFNQQVASGDIGDGRFDNIRSYSLSRKEFLGCIPMPREIVREGFVQSMHYDNGVFYFFTGGSFSGTETNNKRVTSIYKASDTGLLIEGKNFRADSFARKIGIKGEEGVSYEAQGIVTFKGVMKLLIYVGKPVVGSSWHIIQESADGFEIAQGIGSSSYMREVIYNNFSDINIDNDSLLSSGDALGAIAGRMLNNSKLITALDPTNYSAITNQLGISAGYIEITRVNPHRIYGVVKSTIGQSPSYMYTFSVFGRVSTPLVRVDQSLIKPFNVYEGSVVVDTSTEIPIETKKYSKITIFITNWSIGNPCGVITLTSDVINTIIELDVPVALSNGPASLSFKLTNDKLKVITVSGSPVIQKIIGS